jgi:hypothetical protein
MALLKKCTLVVIGLLIFIFIFQCIIAWRSLNRTQMASNYTEEDKMELVSSIVILVVDILLFALTFFALWLNKSKLLAIIIGSYFIKFLAAALYFREIIVFISEDTHLVAASIFLIVYVIVLCYLQRQMKAIENEKFLNKKIRRKVNRRQNNRRNHDNQLITIDQSAVLQSAKASKLSQSLIRTKEQTNSSKAVSCCPKYQQVLQDQPGPEYFFRACCDGQKKIVRQLLSDHGHQLDIQQVEPDTGYTAFHLACAGGHLSVVQQLLKTFGNETCRHLLTNEGKSGLVLAAEYERIEIVQTILTTYKKTEMR